MSDIGPLRETKPENYRVVTRAINAIERSLGGRHLPDTHKPEQLNYGVKGGRAQTTGCQFRARVALPYKGISGHPNFATICVIDDAGWLMPRVAEAVGR